MNTNVCVCLQRIIFYIYEQTIKHLTSLSRQFPLDVMSHNSICGQNDFQSSEKSWAKRGSNQRTDGQKKNETKLL